MSKKWMASAAVAVVVAVSAFGGVSVANADEFAADSDVVTTTTEPATSSTDDAAQATIDEANRLVEEQRLQPEAEEQARLAAEAEAQAQAEAATTADAPSDMDYSATTEFSVLSLESVQCSANGQAVDIIDLVTWATGDHLYGVTIDGVELPDTWWVDGIAYTPGDHVYSYTVGDLSVFPEEVLYVSEGNIFTVVDCSETDVQTLLVQEGQTVHPTDTVTFVGTGFVPGDTISIRFQDTGELIATGVTTDGSFMLAGTIPSGTTIGDRTVIALGETTGSASVILSVLPEVATTQPTITFDEPPTASVGSDDVSIVVESSATKTRPEAGTCYISVTNSNGEEVYGATTGDILFGTPCDAVIGPVSDGDYSVCVGPIMTDGTRGDCEIVIPITIQHLLADCTPPGMPTALAGDPNAYPIPSATPRGSWLSDEDNVSGKLVTVGSDNPTVVVVYTFDDPRCESVPFTLVYVAVDPPITPLDPSSVPPGTDGGANAAGWSGNQLPNTGSNVGGFLGAGFAFVLVGAALLVMRLRRRSALAAE